MKKQKKNLIVKIIRLVGKAIAVTLVAVGIIAMFFMASLQASYKYNEPTEAEIEQNPLIVEFLTGKEAK